MNKSLNNLTTPPRIVPLSTEDQSYLKGGMATTDEDKPKKAKKLKEHS